MIKISADSIGHFYDLRLYFLSDDPDQGIWHCGIQPAEYQYKVAVFLVYLFILYSSFGGFNSVTKSDCLNLIMLSVSIGVLYLVIVKNVPGHWFLTDQTVHELIKSKGVFENQTAEIGIFVYISMFFGWGMGLQSNPQYMVRILAAKVKKPQNI